MSIPKLKKAIKEQKLIYGTQKTLKNLKLGLAKVVFLASNCPENIKKEIKSYSDVEIIDLTIPNDEIAMICKRPHPISVLSY